MALEAPEKADRRGLDPGCLSRYVKSEQAGRIAVVDCLQGGTEGWSPFPFAAQKVGVAEPALYAP